MNYWERHIGDYARDTAHLSMVEHGAYTLLLDRYYATEKPIPADQVHRLARARSRDEKAAVDAILGEFFVLVDGEWHHNRADREIEKAAGRISAARGNGLKGGRPRKPTETQEKPNGLLPGSDSETQPKALHTPDTSNNPLSPAHDDRLDIPGLSDHHPEDWQPDQARLAAYLQRAGTPMPSPESLTASLLRFNLNFKGKSLTDGETYSRLVTWLTGDHNRNGNRPQVAVIPAAGGRRLTAVERVEQACSAELERIHAEGD